MAYQSPLNGGRINASIGGNSTSAGAGYRVVSTGTLSLMGGNNITLSQNGQSVSIIGSGGAGLSAAGNSVSNGTLVFSNSNGVSFGMAGSTLTGTVATTYAASNHSHGNPTLNLTNISGTTDSASNGMTLSLSAAPMFQAGISTLGATYGTSGMFSNRLVFAGNTNIPIIQQTDANGATINFSANAFTGGVSNIGNTSGVTGTHLSGMVLAGGNNITLSQSTGTNGLTVTISGGAGGGGAGLSAGTQSVSTGTVNFANSNGIIFGMSGSNQITASHNGITSQTAQTQSNIQGVIASGSTNRTGDISFANSNSITFGLSNNTVTASYSQSHQTQGFTATSGGAFNTTLTSTGTFDARSFRVAGMGNVSVGFSNSSLIISGSGGGGAGGGIAFANSETTYTSGTVNLIGDSLVSIYTAANQSLRVSIPGTSSLSATGALSISTNGATITMGVPAFSAGISTDGNTGGNTGFATNRLQFVGGSFVSLYQSTSSDGNTITIHGPNPGVRGFSAGTQSVTTGTINFVNGNGITFGMSGSSQITASHNGITSQSVQSQSNIQGVIASGSTNRTGDISFASSNGITFGLSNNTITASHNGITSQSNQLLTLNAATAGNTFSSTSGTANASNLAFRGYGNVSVGVTNGSVLISGSGGAGGGLAFANSQTTYTSGTANLAVAGGAMTIASTTGQSFNFSVPATSSLVGVNGITISTNGSTISISGGGGGGGGAALANSQTTYSTGTINLAGDGPVTVYSSINQSYRISIPQTSSLSATGAFSISANGGTISMGVPAQTVQSQSNIQGIIASGSTNRTGDISFANSNGITFGLSNNTMTASVGAAGGGTISNWEPQPMQYVSLSNSQLGQGSVYIYKLQVPTNISASQLLQLASISLSSATNSSHAGVISQYAGIFTANGSTLSLITASSGSIANQWTNSSNNSFGSITGLKGLSLPLSVSMSPGNYYLALMSRTSSTNANWFTASQMLITNMQTAVFQGMLGQASNVTQGIQEAAGMFSATSAGLPASIPMSQISQATVRAMPYIAFKNVTY